ncbi:hypothetical protein AAFF_G00184580 [Aldrovandia affinis]|uniref:Uncharacterized protein n=1 Tax=Aldrovandia affinis TaxID=143900 RepID=A0AAD7RMK7_9TELE|nr:hypothetical protein AAFF_G00184580 [Aldrovandia affinis]
MAGCACSHSAGNSELVETLEGVLLCWAQQIEQVLTESEQMRKEADDIGPSAELEHWKSRTATFNSLLDEVKSPHVKKVMGVLQVAKSRTLRRWKELDGNITNAANEAKDNVKYLYTLEKFFSPLGRCTPTSMLEHIPRLMNSIRMIHSISQYYNTSERMTSLFVKITNQMISTCKAYLCQGVTRIWEHDRPELLRRINECSQLNQEYQLCFQRVQEKLRENPNDKQFEFSENYIFGKFDTFCKRLEKIANMTSTMENLSGLQHLKIEGIEKICVRYATIVTSTKTKAYNVLDHRKLEFDNDYAEFRHQVHGLYQSLQTLLDSWFEQTLTTERMLDLLVIFENVTGSPLDLMEKYMIVLQHYGRDLEMVRKLYQRQRDNPPTPRNMPPVPEMKKVIGSYNKMAAVLMEYELLYHRGWCQAVEMGQRALNASLLIRHPETKDLYVNLDPLVPELLHEARYMHKMGFEVPEVILNVCANEAQLKALHVRLQEMLQDFQQAQSVIPALLLPLMQPFITRVEDALSPGLTLLSWTSLNTERFMKNVYSTLQELEQVGKMAQDTLECRIERALQAMSSTALLVLPEEEPVQVHAFQSQAESTVRSSGQALSTQSQQVERSMYEMIEDLKRKMKPAETVNLEDSFQCLHPDAKQKTRCQACLPCRFYSMIGQLCQRNTDALVRATKVSLDSLKRRLHVVSSKYQASSQLTKSAAQTPLFSASIQLAIPNIVMRPSLEDIQSILNRVVNTVLSMAKDVPLWTFSHLHHKQLQAEQLVVRDAGDESLPTKQIVLKPLDRQLSEHKDVTKAVVQLGSIVSSLKADAGDVLEEFAHFSTLWNQDPEEQVKEFLETSPSLPEFSSQIASYSKLEAQIEDLPAWCTVGSVRFDTELLKLSLTQECRAWKRAFGAALNHQASADMAEIYTFVDGLSKRLQRPVGDLEDVRGAMAALREVREAEIRIDRIIGPVEESFALLNRHELFFSDGNAEKVDGLAYAWKNLNTQVGADQADQSVIT